MIVLKIEVTTIKETVIILAKPDEVYEAYVDPKKHTAFTGSKATGEPTIGGKFTAWDGYVTGKHIELEKSKRIVQEWMTSEWPQGYPPSRLELILKRVKDGTALSMVHSGLPADQAGDIKKGWIEFYWNPLKSYFGKK